MEKDGHKLLKESGRVINFRGKQYVVLIATNPVSDMMIQGGFEQKASYTIRWLLAKGSDLAQNPPTYGEQLEVYGLPMVIIGKTYRPPSPWLDTPIQNMD